MSRMVMEIAHTTVMADESFSYLSPPLELAADKGESLLIDCTMGEGGHSEIFLSRRPNLSLVGLDADPEIIAVAKERLSPFSDRLEIYNTWFNVFFREYPRGLKRPDAILFDLGISLYHYERADRGFSFRYDQPLDMRLQDGLELSAADIVNNYPENELADVIYLYGEERYSRRIARAIVHAREDHAVQSSAELAGIIASSVPAQYRRGHLNPATRTFQALRIAVNGELARLEAALVDALSILEIGGRIGVIAFHSLEDRIVKEFFRRMNNPCTCPPDAPICICGKKKSVDLVTRKPVRPSETEVTANPPSRSARFRVVQKVAEVDS